MSRVEELLQELLLLQKCEDCNIGSLKVVPALFAREKLYDLIQAVRDEEFERHCASMGVGPCRHADCDDCPAKGTRYCP